MELRSLARNISSQWVMHALTAVVGIAMPPFLIATLGDEGYMVHTLIGDLGGYASLLYLGFGAAILKYVAEHNARSDLEALNETVSTIFTLYLRLGVLCLVVALMLAVPLPWVFKLPSTLVDAGRVRLAMTGAVILFEFVGSVFGGVLMGMERFDQLNAIKLGLLLGRTLALIAVVSTWPSVIALGVVSLVASLLEQLVTWRLAHRALPGLRVSLALYRPERLAHLATFSVQSFVFTMSERLINYTDNLVIMQARGASAGAAYALPLRLVEFAREALDRATHVLMPGVSAAVARGELTRVQSLWRTGTRALLALAMPVALVQVCWGDHVLALWLSANDRNVAARVVAEGYPCFVWLALAFVMQVMGRGLTRPLFEGLGELRVPARVALVEGAVNLGLSVVLVRVWGIAGVAFATFVPAAITGLFVMPWFACARFGVSYTGHMAATLGRALPPLVPAWLVLWFAERARWHTHLATLTLACAGVLVVYLAAACWITFDGDERMAFAARLHRC